MRLTCPNCKSDKILGLLPEIWVELLSDGRPDEESINAVLDEQEISLKKVCVDCDHEFGGEEPAEENFEQS